MALFSSPRSKAPPHVDVEGWVVHQENNLRLMAWHPDHCPVEVADVWWGRHGRGVCVWADGWKSTLVLPDLSESAWEALDQGHGQWWGLEPGFPDAPRAVFQLTADRRRDAWVA